MASKVGQKGQVIIEKKIRDELGIEPGALAIQRLVGDHVEMRFIPPTHKRSLKGILARHTSRHIPLDKWAQAKEEAWSEAASEQEGRQ